MTAESLMNRLFKEKCSLTEETQKDDDVNVSVENSNMKSKNDLKY
jgi:hypothetical protein